MMTRLQLLGVTFTTLSLLCAGNPALAQVETYKIDPVHSSVSFKIRHFFSKVTGTFNTFEGTIQVDRADMEKSSVSAGIDVASIDTNNQKRDDHLRSADFFDAGKFPRMTFTSRKWVKKGENEFEVTGDLSFHGVTREVVLKVKSLGFGEGMRDAYLSGWEASTSIQKSDFGITYGGATLGDEVDIHIQVEAQRQ